jgi:hypothetical protein
MAVTVDYDNFRFSSARYVRPHDISLHGHAPANSFIADANQIVREIARAGWDVPGFDVTIRYYGSGTNVLKHCSSVSFDVPLADGSTEKATIRYFNKAGRQVGRWNQLGCASAFKMGDFEVNLYDDGSGDWKKTEALQKANEVVRAALAAAASLPSKDGYDVDHPEGDLNLREICIVPPTPAPSDFPTLYAWVERGKAQNALGVSQRLGDSDDEWARDDEYRLTGNGWRFVNTDHGIGWDEIPPGGWDGYDYASPDICERPAGLCMPNSSGCFPVEVKLRHLDDIYVADMAPFEQALEAAAAEAEAAGRKEWRKGEYGDFIRKSMVTFVPAAEYKGGYVKPVYMIGRQLQADEARGMVGPVSVKVDDEDFVVAQMHDNRTGKDVVLFEGGNELYHKKRAVDEAWVVARILGTEPDIASSVNEALEEHRQRIREKYKDDKTMQMLI